MPIAGAVAAAAAVAGAATSIAGAAAAGKGTKTKTTQSPPGQSEEAKALQQQLIMWLMGNQGPLSGGARTFPEYRAQGGPGPNFAPSDATAGFFGVPSAGGGSTGGLQLSSPVRSALERLRGKGISSGGQLVRRPQEKEKPIRYVRGIGATY